MSLADRDASTGSRTMSALGHAVAGLQATMAEAILLFAPNASSLRRLRPLSYAPTASTWGHNNRTVALRVPAGAPDARRIEHRAAGADANPYLGPAAVLAGIHHGLTHELQPNAPIEATLAPGRPQSAAALGARSRRLPGRASCATISARPSATCIGVCRAAERDRFADVVTLTEYAWYLNTV